MQACDVAIASRYQPGSKVVGLSTFRQLLSNGASWLFRLYAPVSGVKDYTCGFRAYRASLLQQAFARYGNHFITENGFTCMAEILIKLARLGARFREIPFVLHYEYKMSTSKMDILQTTQRSLLFLIKSRS
jgi:dolichol-phosphate mannosyltransferase